jgi:ABC-2 type transport system ATP-binding protein
VTNAIEAHDLVKTYPGDVQALRGLSVSVEAGTIFGMLGPNGAGKSTTVKILTTLARADSGSAIVAGHDVVKEQDRVRRSIGVVAQRSGVDREATGRENLRLQGQMYGLGGRPLEQRVDFLLESFGLADAAGRIVKTYSGGMQRRLDVALGLVHEPEVLFLDEPTTGLDPEVRADMWREIKRLADEQHITILLTTHYLEEADELTRRLVIVDRGEIVAEGTADELKGQLRGDAIQLVLEDAQDRTRVEPALERLGTLREVRLDGQTVSARVDDGARAIPAVLQALDGNGVAVASVTVSRPSLDDVYLSLTGRSFSAAETDEAKKQQQRAAEARR